MITIYLTLSKRNKKSNKEGCIGVRFSKGISYEEIVDVSLCEIFLTNNNFSEKTMSDEFSYERNSNHMFKFFELETDGCDISKDLLLFIRDFKEKAEKYFISQINEQMKLIVSNFEKKQTILQFLTKNIGKNLTKYKVIFKDDADYFYYLLSDLDMWCLTLKLDVGEQIDLAFDPENIVITSENIKKLSDEIILIDGILYNYPNIM